MKKSKQCLKRLLCSVFLMKLDMASFNKTQHILSCAQLTSSGNKIYKSVLCCSTETDCWRMATEAGVGFTSTFVCSSFQHRAKRKHSAVSWTKVWWQPFLFKLKLSQCRCKQVPLYCTIRYYSCLAGPEWYICFIIYTRYIQRWGWILQ